MINSPTVFVLGAGASKPFGFPLGAQLKDWICEAVNDEDWIRRELHEKLDIDLGAITEFARAVQHSHINSIDAFLLRRPEFNRIGKFAIAAHLCRLENPEVLASTADRQHWYRFLWNKMAANAHSANDITRNQVRFVSFNYDRSLERFLFVACKNTYGLSDNQAHKVSTSFGIIHAYGLLGRFHYAGDQPDDRAYDADLSATTLRIAADGIRLIPEERSQDVQFNLARNWLDWAERICFLGFGFDSSNCENLDLVSVLDWNASKGKPPPRMYSSALGLTGQEVEDARKLACGRHGWTACVADNVMTLRELGVLS